jgi:hypothetical protein
MITARRLVRWAAATVATGAALIAMSRLSATPLPFAKAGMSRLRLSWSARPERIEVCRTVSAEELAREEEHMRQRVECEGHFATYALRVEADGRLLSESVVRGAGLRHDRPIYLLRDIDLASGMHRIRVSFVRRERIDRDAEGRARGERDERSEADTGLFAGRAEREATERTRRARAAIPPRLVLDTALTFVPNRVLLVTFDADRRALEVLDKTAVPR